MTQDEIIELAREAGFFEEVHHYMSNPKQIVIDYICRIAHLEAFAKLVADAATAKEREACVVDIQLHIPRSGRDTLEYKMAMRIIERIKARG
jgi:hypothetical protein